MESKMQKARILKIPAEGAWEFTEVENDAEGHIPLKTMQTMVGGWIERWPLEGYGLGGLDLIIDEEGKLKRCPCNTVATILSEILRHGDCIVGDAFVCANDEDLFSVGFSSAQEAALRRRLAELGL